MIDFFYKKEKNMMKQCIYEIFIYLSLTWLNWKEYSLYLSLTWLNWKEYDLYLKTSPWFFIYKKSY
jgi:hypothetical protein